MDRLIALQTLVYFSVTFNNLKYALYCLFSPLFSFPFCPVLLSSSGVVCFYLNSWKAAVWPIP